MFKRMSTLVALVAIIGIAGFAAAKEARQGRKPKVETLKGAVMSVDGNVVTVKKAAPKGQPAEEVKVETDATTVVTIDGQPGKVSDLAKRMRVVIEPVTGKATKITATTPKKKKNQ